jgi:manganese transport protein
MQLGFAVIPLIHFCSDKKTMGEYAIRPLTQIVAWIIAVILVYLNVRLLIGEAVDFFETSDSVFWKSVIISGGVIVTMLLVYIVVQPLIKNKSKKDISFREPAVHK